MSDHPLLTVTMPVYNVEKYLPKALDSMIHQTFKDWELIAVDDGSTDSSGQILEDYAAREARIKLIHQSNGGLTSARKAALKLSQGEYVTFFDSDDWIEPDMYEQLVKYMQAENLDIVVGGHVEEYNGKVKLNYQPMEAKVFSHDQALVELLSHRHHAWGLCDKLYRRSLLRRYNLSQHWVCGEDLLTNWIVYKQAVRIGYTPVYGYHYIKHGGSLTTAEYSWKRYTIIEVLEEIAKDMNQMPQNVRDAFASAWRARALGAMTGMVLSENQDFDKEFAKLQKSLRRDMSGVLADNNLSKVRKLLACYFSLPAAFCHAGRPVLAYGEHLIKG